MTLLVVSCSSKKELRRGEFSPEEALKEATRLIEEEEFDRARELLLQVKNRDTSGRYAPLAQLKLAESYLKDEDPDTAIYEYRRFLRLYPDHPQAPFAQYQIAMIYFRQIESPDKGAGGARKAMEEFQRLLRDYPRNPFREAAKLKIKQCRDLMAEYEYLVGRFYFKKGSYRAAIGRFRGILKDFPEYRRIPEVLYLIGISYKRLGQQEEADRFLRELLERFPDSKEAKKAEKELRAKT